MVSVSKQRRKYVWAAAISTGGFLSSFASLRDFSKSYFNKYSQWLHSPARHNILYLAVMSACLAITKMTGSFACTFQMMYWLKHFVCFFRNKCHSTLWVFLSLLRTPNYFFLQCNTILLCFCAWFQVEYRMQNRKWVNELSRELRLNWGHQDKIFLSAFITRKWGLKVLLLLTAPGKCTINISYYQILFIKCIHV